MTSFSGQCFQPPPEAEEFYIKGLKLLAESDAPFLLCGTYAVTAYTGIVRPTKDLDIFCKASDYPRILSFFRDRGYQIAVEDERWIAKILSGRYYFDVIFSCRATRRHRGMVRERARDRYLRRQGEHHQADRADLVEDLRAGPLPL